MPNDPDGLDASPVSAHATGELFSGFFTRRKDWRFRKQDLIDARARHVFELMTRACEEGVYPYQFALQGRSGPWVFVEGKRMLMLSTYR